ncbi:unnamed protein product [Peniophora sp. CBMAI 1063]|nr:unnamed protein product [Peniophora sp. CBMAI 1063]
MPFIELLLPRFLALGGPGAIVTMVAVQHSIQARGFSVSIRPARWTGREAEPLPVYGSFRQRIKRGSDAHGYVIVWDKCTFELVITDTTGGISSIAYVFVDGKEVFRTYLPGTKQTVVVKGAYEERGSRVYPLFFRRRTQRSVLGPQDKFGMISIVFREPLPPSPHYRRKAFPVMSPTTHRSRDFVVWRSRLLSPISSRNATTDRSGRFDVEPLATLNIRYTSGRTLFQEILYQPMDLNERQENQRNLGEYDIPPLKRRRLEYKDQLPIVTDLNAAARVLVERHLYPPSAETFCPESEKQPGMRYAFAFKESFGSSPTFRASPLRNELRMTSDM